MVYVHAKHVYRNPLHYRLEEALVKEILLRRKRSVEEWIAAERRIMLDIVNEECTLRGKLPLIENDICRVEQHAMGHVDYTHKFSLYCVELVGNP